MAGGCREPSRDEFLLSWGRTAPKATYCITEQTCTRKSWSCFYRGTFLSISPHTHVPSMQCRGR